MHGDSQEIQINTVPQGASVHIQGEGITAVAPTKLILKRGYPMKEYSILVQKEGYKPGYATIKQKPSAWLWGDIIWAIIPGVAVDMITGGAFDLTPEKITVQLEESAK